MSAQNSTTLTAQQSITKMPPGWFPSLWALLAVVAFSLEAADLIPATNAPATNAPASKLYLMAPEDTVKIVVFHEDDLSAVVRLKPDGKATLPLLGDVKLGGKTEEEARDMIHDALAKDYLVNPQVSVVVVEYSKKKFTILGQVPRPGPYEIPSNQSTSLIDALALAGGGSPLANLNKVIVRRQVGNRSEKYTLDAKAMMRDTNAKGFEILTGDVIEVPETRF